jgi:hypothetical protein
MFHFLSICIENWQKVLICSKKISHNFHIEVSKNAEFYADSKFLKNWFKRIEEIYNTKMFAKVQNPAKTQNSSFPFLRLRSHFNEF